MTFEKIKYLTNEKFVILLITILFAIAYILTFGKWAYILLDCFHDYYIASALHSGKHLYADVPYLYPPLVPYLFKILFGIFKPHLNLFYIFGGITAYLFTLALYGTARQVLSIKNSFLLVMLFLVTCGFQPGNQNYIFSYVVPAILSPLFAMGTLFFILLHYKSSKPYFLYLSSVLTILCFLTKIEFAYAQAALMIIYSTFLFIQKDNRFKDSIYSVILVILATISIYFILYQYYGLEQITNLLFPVGYTKAAAYFVEKSGLGITSISIFCGLTTLLNLIIISIIFIGSGYLYFKKLKKKPVLIFIFILFIALMVYLISKITWLKAFIALYYVTLFAGANFIVLFSLIYFIKNIKKDSIYFKLAIISIFSLLISSRTPFFMSITPYGSYYLPPVFIILFYFLFNLLPDTIFKKLNREIYIKSSTIFIAFLILFFTITDARIYSTKNILISQKETGFIYAGEDYGKGFNTIINIIKEDFNKKDKIFVIPEEVIFYTFLNTSAPGKFYYINPAAFGNSEKNNKQLYTDLKNDPPKYIIASNQDRYEFGPKEEIDNYYKKHVDIITANYELMKTVQTSHINKNGKYYKLNLYKLKK